MKQYLKNNKKNYLPGGVISGTQGSGSQMMGDMKSFIGDNAGLISSFIPNKQSPTVSSEGQMAQQLTEQVAGKVAGPLGSVIAKGANAFSNSSLFKDEECIQDVNGKTICYDKKQASAGLMDIGNTVDNYKYALSSLAKGNVKDAALSGLSTLVPIKSPLQKEQEQKYREAQQRVARSQSYAALKSSNMQGLQRKQSQIQDDQLQGFNQQFFAKKGGSTKKWIQKAVKSFEEKGTKGALTKQAKASGKSISEFCQSPPSDLAKKRCQFRKNVNK